MSRPAEPREPDGHITAADIHRKCKLRSARRRALEQSPIGRRAAAVGRALATLKAAADDFLAAHPHRESAEAAGETALVDAGLPPESNDDGWGFDHFAAVPTELRGWMAALDALAGRIEDSCQWSELP